MESLTLAGFLLLFLCLSADNGLNPVFDDSFEFDVLCRPMAYLRFVVYDEDMFGDPNFIAQAVFPFESLRIGRLAKRELQSVM